MRIDNNQCTYKDGVEDGLKFALATIEDEFEFVRNVDSDFAVGLMIAQRKIEKELEKIILKDGEVRDV